MGKTVPEIVKEKVSHLIEMLTQDDLLNPPACSSRLIDIVNDTIESINEHIVVRGRRLKYLTDMPTYAIADFIAARGDVALIAPKDKSNSQGEDDAVNHDHQKLPIAIYQTEGLNRGIWQISNDSDGLLGDLVAQYKPNATRADKKEVFTSLKGKLPVKYRCAVPYYAPVGNCIVDVLNKDIIPFSPDFVFTSKVRTHFNPNATNPFILMEDGTSYWNVDDWMQSLAPNDPELVECLWQVIRAAMLPNMPAHKIVIMLSKTGNNGKGTLCALIRTLLGENRAVSIPLADFSKDFGVANLPSAMCVVCDENDTNKFSDSNGVLKSATTGDTITINIKHERQFDTSWSGAIIQCCNAIPRVSDKTGSFRRRLLLLPMPSCFTGKEVKAIKQDYIHRREVREYVLYKVLWEMPYSDSFTIPQCAEAMMEEYKLVSNSVTYFCETFLDEFTWDLLPCSDLLFPVYKGWYKEVHPSGNPIGYQEFVDQIKEYVRDPDNNCAFEWTDSTRSKGRMSERENLLIKYGIRNFELNFAYSDGYARYVKEKYSGLKRIVPSTYSNSTDDDSE